MLGESEIFGIPIAIVVFILWWAWRSQQEDTAQNAATPPPSTPAYTGVGWSDQIRCDASFEVAKALFRVMLTSSYSWTLWTESQKTHTYRRGDRSIVHLPCDRDISWEEIPAALVLTFEENANATTVSVALDAPPSTQFDEASKDYFHRHASQELAMLTETINSLLNDSQEPADENSSTTSDSEDNVGEDSRDDSAPPPMNPITPAEDLQILGLDANADWDAVRKAYRTLVMQIHPDVLSSKDIPPLLEKIAVQKFKDATLAYHRLRESVGNNGSTNDLDPTQIVSCPYCGQRNRLRGDTSSYKCGKCGVSFASQDETYESRDSRNSERSSYESHEADASNTGGPQTKVTDDDDFAADEDSDDSDCYTLESFCKVCPAGIITVFVNTEKYGGFESWYKSATAHCPDCYQSFSVQELITPSEIPSCFK